MTPDDGRPAPPPPEPLATTVHGETSSTNPDPAVPTGALPSALALPAPGYALGSVIGRGGMGEVLTARDLRIGRDVAIKRMRSTTPSDPSIVRFLREARIQARLDHPAIVPVYELGIDDDGRPFFTMKQLAGVTLAQRMSEGGPGKPLLRAFIDVCLAIEFAHARHVVHRDLKPANIMLGDYGEVYVLDWGIARVVTEAAASVEVAASDIDTLDDGTQTGELLGTPGYMSPEQARGHEVGPPSDVYALGSILFELLTGEALHPRGIAGLASTLAAAPHGPAARVPEREVAPELDAACVAALASEPGDRPSARELADAVQLYLDGDRDVERRRVLAAEQLELAKMALASGDPEARATAINGAGRALALDPSSAEAARLVTGLIVAPPHKLPAELVAAIVEEDRRVSTQRIGASALSLVAVMLLAGLLPFMTIRNWTTLGLALVALVTCTGWLWRAYLRGQPSPYMNLATGFVLAVAFTRVLGPFVLTPVVIAGALLAMAANPWVHARPLVVAGWLLAVVAAPELLEWSGAFATSWSMTDGGVTTHSAIIRGRSGADALELVIANLGLLAAFAVYAVRVSRAATDASRKLYIQAWHLGQLLPAGRISVS